MNILDTAHLVSKVLILDDMPDGYLCIKNFCDRNQLLAVRAQYNSVMTVLEANIDFGAIFLAEGYGGEDGRVLNIASAIRKLRPELPIFLRRTSGHSDQRSNFDKTLYRRCYVGENIDDIEPDVKSSIFSLVYPNQLVRGITEITIASLASQFKDLEIVNAPPYVVRDRIMFGELFTLIPLESDWCRGYMLLQSNEAPLKLLVEDNKTHLEARQPTFREINDLLGEVTNLVWGAFKNRFVIDDIIPGRRSQVPIIVNHLRRYISFGSEEPQLCFSYTLTDPSGVTPPLTLDQRFIFNMDWSPEKFRENEVLVGELFGSGELELF